MVDPELQTDLSQARIVLVIADRPDNADLYRHWLDQQGKVSDQVLSATDGAQGVTLCQTHSVRVILLELEASSPTDRRAEDWGLERLAELKKSLGEACPPILAIGRNDAPLAVEAMRAGAVDYLVADQITADSLGWALSRVVATAAETNPSCTGLQQQLQATAAALDESRDELERRSQIFDALLATISDFVYLLDRQGRFVFVNQPLLDLWGLRLAEAVGKTFFELNYPPALAAKHQREIEHVFVTGQTVQDESTYVSPTGVSGIYEYIFKPMLGPEGAVQFVGGSTRNITHRQRAEAALRESEARFRSFAENSRDVIWITDLQEERLVYVSPSFEQVWGRPVADVYDDLNRFIGFAHPDDRDRIRTSWQQCRRRGTSQDYRIVRPDGAMVWIRDRCFPIFDDQGKLLWMGGIAEDITEHKQIEDTLRQREAELRLITDAVPSLISFIDAQRRYRYNNRSYENWFGQLAQDNHGKHMREVLGEAAYAVVRPYVERVLAGEQVTFETQVPYKDGGTRYISATYVPQTSAEGAVEGFVALVNDTTDRRRADQEREQLLDRERAARNQAEAANRIKDEFLAVVSHELRTPLNPILGWSQLLRDRQLDAQKTQYALSVIERNAQIQAQLINDLLDVSRVLRGKLSLNTTVVDLAVTIRAAVETVRLAAEAKRIQLDTKLEADVGRVSGDADRLQQVVWNLLSNAVKFTSEGGQVEVRLSRVRVDRRKKDRGEDATAKPLPPLYAQITVSDTGKGIHPAFLPYVFDRFRQEDAATTRQFGGLGLGLALVRYLVELHGGIVQADSPGDGQGATFTVQLPLAPPAAADSPSANPAAGVIAADQRPGDLAGVRVLVVDDDQGTREFITFLLELHQAQVIAASSAAAAIAALEQGPPDILLSDIGMPGTDGYTLMRQVRDLPPDQGGDLPAIALTAYAGEIDYRQAIAAGFHKHMPKPVEPQRLIEAIAALVRHRPSP
ncbi:PAS domain S-box protein [Leptolyngbya sp. KIOST-1]|uniref:PAS domain S-box protein n=1 Tax=Leptolyngbya sp. KIOST-1 TaxID=1229172 RepID=UPI0018CE1B5E|nr:PAS domain S-box protein [Leptolyngbya sp. KIOST-1]